MGPNIGFKDLKIVDPKIKEHFISYPLMTNRLVNFKLWCEVLNIVENKKHLTVEGLAQMDPKN